MRLCVKEKREYSIIALMKKTETINKKNMYTARMEMAVGINFNSYYSE
jgi:hypothetical protein